MPGVYIHSAQGLRTGVGNETHYYQFHATSVNFFPLTTTNSAHLVVNRHQLVRPIMTSRCVISHRPTSDPSCQRLISTLHHRIIAHIPASTLSTYSPPLRSIPLLLFQALCNGHRYTQHPLPQTRQLLLRPPARTYCSTILIPYPIPVRLTRPQWSTKFSGTYPQETSKQSAW